MSRKSLISVSLTDNNEGRETPHVVSPTSKRSEDENFVYETPRLIHYGDVRDVTLGPTVGIGESGNELGRRNPP